MPHDIVPPPNQRRLAALGQQLRGSVVAYPLFITLAPTAGVEDGSIEFDPATIFDPENGITGGYYGTKGLLSPLEDVQRELARLDTAELAAASVPACLRMPSDELPPVLWGAEEWRAVEERQRAEPLFDMEAVRAQFSPTDFERDGFQVLRGVMTPATTVGTCALLPAPAPLPPLRHDHLDT